MNKPQVNECSNQGKNGEESRKRENIQAWRHWLETRLQRLHVWKPRLYSNLFGNHCSTVTNFMGYYA